MHDPQGKPRHEAPTTCVPPAASPPADVVVTAAAAAVAAPAAAVVAPPRLEEMRRRNDGRARSTPRPAGPAVGSGLGGALDSNSRPPTTDEKDIDGEPSPA